jgi:hypothetical protein
MSISEKLTTIAENQQKVYDAGADKATKEFWDVVQDRGARSDYAYAFYRWNAEYIRPYYKVVPKTYYPDMFRYCTKLKKIESQYFDMSQYTPQPTANTAGYYRIFHSCSELEEIEDIGMKAGGYYQTYSYCSKLKKIAVWRVTKDCALNAPFGACSALEDITVEGTIGVSLSFQYSINLNVASMKSIITHLYDYSTESPATYTLTFPSNCWDRIEASGKPFDDGLIDDETKTWQDYVTTVLGWNV